MPTQTSIMNLCMDALVNQLTEHLITGVDTTFPEQNIEEAIAGLVRRGKLQDDPTRAGINVLVHPGDEFWKHSINYNVTRSGYSTSAALEIGGIAVHNRRRFKVQLRMFFSGEFDREAAMTKAHVVLSRAEAAIWTLNMATIAQDSFGEKAHFAEVNESYIREGGGPGTFIWDGFLSVTFATIMEPS